MNSNSVNLNGLTKKCMCVFRENYWNWYGWTQLTKCFFFIEDVHLFYDSIITDCRAITLSNLYVLTTFCLSPSNRYVYIDKWSAWCKKKSFAILKLIALCNRRHICIRCVIHIALFYAGRFKYYFTENHILLSFQCFNFVYASISHAWS